MYNLPAKQRQSTSTSNYKRQKLTVFAWYVIHLKKRVNLQQAFQNKSPVKIHGVKRSKTKEDEYSIAKAAKIAPSDVEFPYNKAVASKSLQLKIVSLPAYTTKLTLR